MTMSIVALLVLAAALQHYELKPSQLPQPYHTQSAGNPPRVIARPKNAQLTVPPGFRIELWAEGFNDPRNLVLAPNGDVFLTETAAGRITILRGKQRFTFASGLDGPFGLAFRGNHLYVGNEAAVVRFDYQAGQTKAGTGTRMATLPPGGHSTRNVIFNRDGSKMYVAVGSGSNVSDETAEPM